MYMRLPDNYCDAKQAIEDCLEGGSNRLLKSVYGSTAVRPCTVSHAFIKEVQNQERAVNMDLMLTYKECGINKYQSYEEASRTENLKVLTNKGDDIWPCSMVVTVWDGDYPSGVAVNEDTGVVYFINLRMGGLGLVHFATLSETQLEAFKNDLNDDKPYCIKLDSDAMFNVLSGEEGSRHLKDTLYIEFDCGLKFKVYKNTVGVL